VVSVLLTLAAAASVSGQTRQEPAQTRQESAPQSQTDEVVRVNAELVQTDVSVVDKRGRSVEGLGREQFELRVDGRPVQFSFFESVTAGSPEEETKLAAAVGVAAGVARADATQGQRTAPLRSTARGRVIFFFVDDVHLAADSLARTRTALLRFVDEQMGAGDRAAIVSASGQIGFLQQLTDNKSVLREAVGRLFYKRETEAYSGKVYMSEADANRVQNHRDRELFAYLVEATQNEYQMEWLSAAMLVRDRVRQMNITSRAAEQQTLGALFGLMRSSAPLAGRKLVFLISDGFVVDYKKSDAPDLLRRVTEEAARVGAVVYTLDARGSFTDGSVSASRNDYMEFGTRTTGRSFFDERATKEPLETIAAETGGRAFINDNSFNDAFAEAVDESSGYYLLAWRPDSDEQRAGKSRIEVSVKGHPDLRVRMRRRYFNTAQPTTKPTRHEGATAAKPSAEEELRAALASLYPRSELPLSLSAGYMDTPDAGTVLAASMQLDSASLDFGVEGMGGDAKLDGEAKVDVWGIAIDDRGSFATFKQVLTVSRDALAKAGQRFVLWNQRLTLPSGLYQLRVAARDRQSGRTGSQLQWVEIPARVGAGRISLSSVFIGEVKTGGATTQKVSVNVSRRFARGSRLRFQTFVYGAGRGAWLVMRLRVVRDGLTVLALAPTVLSRDGAADPARIAYSGEASLEQLTAGRYVLEITAEDARAKAVASQQADFVID
jgi:VWFA-related protein